MLSKDNQFEGFSAETIFFLKNLKENNNREWFLARKKDCNKKVLKPASDFVVEMGELLQKISPGIHADPKINRSITRIYRDSRYASEQEPYKTYLGIWFWQGVRKINESPGYYFELRPDQLYLSAGIKSFSRKVLHNYRKAV
ncbi:MAG: TIGR02453 family protein, partial [bacterium]